MRVSSRSTSSRWLPRPRRCSAIGLGQDAARIQSPVLVIDGAADIMPEQATAEWIAALPKARAVVMEGVGHFPSYEAPERFFAILDEFLPPGSDTPQAPGR